MGVEESQLPSESQGAEAVWPPGNLDQADSLGTECQACGISWRIHRCLAGYRLRCRCGSWVTAPGAPVQALPVPEQPRHGALAVAASSELTVAADESAAPPVEFTGIRSWDGKPLERDPDGAWTLRHASLEVRQRWTSRVVIEFALVLTAFWLPPLILQFTTVGHERALWMPISSVAAAILCLLVVQSQPGYVLECMRLPKVGHFIEAAAATGGFLLAALGWGAVIEAAGPFGLEDPISRLASEIGLGLTLFVVAVCPGIFEEIAFRGLIQGRLTRMMGARPAVWISGAAFALAHGITLGSPLQAGLGIYLGSLRLRSGSLLPGMILHITYNGALVLLS